MANVLGVTTYTDILRIAKEESDMVNSSFVSDAEWLDFINASYQELYGLLVQKFGNDYYSTSATISTDGTNDHFDLPSNFFKLYGVDLQLNAGSPASWLTLKPFKFAERNKYGLPNATGRLGVLTLQYRLQGNQIWFIPLPASGQTIKVWYAPRVVSILVGADTIDGVSGWEEYIIIDAAIKAKDKEESDVSVLMARKAAIVQRLESEASNRDIGMPDVVGDVRDSGVGPYGYGYGWGGGYGGMY